MATYKRILDNGRKTGRGGKIWIYFDRVHEIVGKSSSNVSLSKFVVPKKLASTSTSNVNLSTNVDVIEPTSDTEAEDVVVEKSAVELAGQKNTKRCKRDQPPEWFTQFEKRMREDRMDRERKLEDLISKQENYQNERIKVMRETNDLLKMLLMVGHQEE